ncbi:Uncharacterised protein [Enterobacter cloacae]|nr:Uncharacterised protein [Enterobacter cloacae]
MPTSLKVGTTILATNTTRAMGNMSAWIRVTTPPMMVAGEPLPSMLTVMIGNRLAGT